MKTVILLVTVGLLSVGAVGFAAAERAQSPPAPRKASSSRAGKAKAAIQVGDIAAKNNSWAEAIADYKHAIQLDPANAEAHKKFLNACYSSVSNQAPPAGKMKKGKKLSKKEQEKQEQLAQEKRDKAKARLTRNLLKTYDAWIKNNPREALFYWGKGEVLEDSDKQSQALALYRKAIQIDPSCAPAYAALGDDAATQGNVARQREYEEKALALDPKDSSGAFFNYALTYLTTDPAKFAKLVEDRASKFPGDQNLMYLLGLAAQNATARDQKEKLYQQMYKDYGPKSAHPSSDIDDAMLDMFNLYATSAPARALTFARKMQKGESPANEPKNGARTQSHSSNQGGNGLWTTLSKYEKSLIDARALMEQKKYREALALLKKTELKPQGEFDPLSDVDLAPFKVGRARALAGSGKRQAAYDDLKAALVAKPNATLQQALLSYGAQLGKSSGEVERDVWAARETKAKLMTPFDLREYVTNKEVKLADFRGHVTLVNFWFPG
jgi:lipopolysaccharide biosynthesis regulator YciM